MTLEKSVSRVSDADSGFPPSKLRKCGLCGVKGYLFATERARLCEPDIESTGWMLFTLLWLFLPSLEADAELEDGAKGALLLDDMVWLYFLAVEGAVTAVLGRVLTTDYDLFLFIYIPKKNK